MWELATSEPFQMQKVFQNNHSMVLSTTNYRFLYMLPEDSSGNREVRTLFPEVVYLYFEELNLVDTAK